MPDSNSPLPYPAPSTLQAFEELWLYREKQYAEAMRQALQEFSSPGYLPERADPDTLAAAVRKIMDNLCNTMYQGKSAPLVYRNLERQVRDLRTQNGELVERNEQLAAQVKELSQMVARLQARLDRAKTAGEKKL